MRKRPTEVFHLRLYTDYCFRNMCHKQRLVFICANYHPSKSMLYSICHKFWYINYL